MTEFQNRGNIKMKNNIKKLGLALAACALFCGITQAETKQLGKIKSTQNVVVSEEDPVFDSMLNSQYSISLGFDSAASWQKGIAIGMPAILNPYGYEFDWSPAGTGTNYFWRMDYMGNVRAARESVALGDSAQARFPVAVAVGDQAIVGALHGDYENSYPVVLDKMIVTKDGSTSTTNIVAGGVTNWYNAGQYERLPEPSTGWTRIETIGNMDVYSQTLSGGLRDISYLDPDEWNYYNRTIYGGQGDVELYKGYYGVAVGSRAYVFGYHSVALGHYAHVSRPWAMALGSEAHVYSEGSQGIGYDVDIATNAPYSLAVGHSASVLSGMTNAIVIGVPNSNIRNSNKIPYQKPTAVKSNSINFVYHGDGLDDFFLDGIPMTDRLATDVKVIGNTKKTTKSEEVDQGLRELVGISTNDEPIVFFQGETGGIHFYTKNYIDALDIPGELPSKLGDVSEVFINGKSLAQIIGTSSGTDARLDEYKTKINAEAASALNSVTNATNLAEIKNALVTFFTNIQDN